MAKRSWKKQFKPKDSSTKAGLQALLNLFSVDTRWTQGRDARTISRRPVSVHSPAASCFCLQGGIRLIGTWNKGQQIGMRLSIEKVLAKRGFYSIIGFNDGSSRKVSTVRAVIREAIRAS